MRRPNFGNAWARKLGVTAKAGAAPGPPEPKRHKYFAKPTVVDGRRFHSKGEARRYEALKLMERAGMIRGLECQPRYVLHALGGAKVGVFSADFKYFSVERRAVVIEDFKGIEVPLTKWRRRHAEAEYGITVEIVK